MVSEQEKFRIKAYGFGELAQLYLPEIKPKSASARLRSWINSHEILKEKLALSGYRKGIKLLTPEMVKYLVRHLGPP